MHPGKTRPAIVRSAITSGTTDHPTGIRQGPARAIVLGSATIEILVTGEESGGRVETLVFTAPPGFPGPPPHRHPHAEETFHVLEGEMEFVVDGQRVRAGAGTTVHVPCGVSHAFSYVGGRTVRFMATLSPAQRMDEYFDRVAVLVRGKTRPFDEATRAELARLMLEFGQEPG